jgi:hypothetical protein
VARRVSSQLLRLGLDTLQSIEGGGPLCLRMQPGQCVSSPDTPQSSCATHCLCRRSGEVPSPTPVDRLNGAALDQPAHLYHAEGGKHSTEFLHSSHVSGGRAQGQRTHRGSGAPHRGQRAAGSGQRAEGCGQRAADSGQRYQALVRSETAQSGVTCLWCHLSDLKISHVTI